MKSILLTFIIALISNCALAESVDLKSSIAELSADLASINRQVIEIYNSQHNSTTSHSTGNTSSANKIDFTEDKIPYLDVKNATQAKKPQDTYNKFINIYGETLKEMHDLKTKFDNNPYIKITGMEINIGIVPSVSVSMVFKK